MTDIEIDDTQLVWPGKFTKEGKLRDKPGWNLPFQIIETVNETRATRKSKNSGVQQSLFEVWSGNEGKTTDTGWKNKLIWGDNAFVMSSLLERFAGKIDLIYIDPPFNTGDDFSHSVKIGDDEVIKEPSALEVRAYRDTWGRGTSSYLDMMYDRLSLIRQLLSPSGSIYVHLDQNIGHYVKIMMDEIFGRENFVNEIAWKRSHAHSDTKQGAKHFGRSHDTILFYSKDKEDEANTWRQQFTPHEKEYLDGFYKQVELPNGTRRPLTKEERADRSLVKGRIYKLDNMEGPGGASKGNPRYEVMGVTRYWRYSKETMQKKIDSGRVIQTKEGNVPMEIRYLDESPGIAVQDMWTDITPLSAFARERVGFPTQKPEALLERIITASSNPNDLVADFFCGSGTALVVAERLGRRWIGCDLSRFGIHATRKRLLDIEGCKPFEILNLGKYERQIWQGISFSGKSGQSLVSEYLAFLLKLYDAQPISGFQFVHGRRQSALVHVGSVEAPVTISEVLDTVNEVVSARQSELHVLGWEWEMGIHDLVETDARNKGVKVRLLQIPNEVMDPQIPREDVKFFDLAYIKARTIAKRETAQVELQDFGIPSSDLIPAEVRSQIKHWSDLIDYWAVDFDFKNDTFLNNWQAYRADGDARLDLKSMVHEYKEHRKYKILVKVVDVFGIDSSKVLEVEV
ncbi:MAG TPA: site-specific DNA-methyltransferase [Nitrososphaerales archaeon]|nr:site-specific DNA-methyltransferase [Nitrososphaerales archaeon]